MPNAIAFVLGFGTIFTLLGTTIYVAVGPLRVQHLDLLRQAGGIILILLGLNLMGLLRVSRLMGTWRPLDGLRGRRPGAQRRGVVGGFTLGAIFAIGWTPCIGPTLGAILGLAAIGTSPQVVALLVAYSLGLGIPFIALALAVDRAPAITRPLIRHGRTIELIGGALVVLIGTAILFDWLAVLYRTFSFLVPQV
jgi:cytochrome c-type biogenesis protein